MSEPSENLEKGDQSKTQSDTTDKAGGCSLGCGALFLLAGLLWPILHLLSDSKEPELFFIPAVIGLPSFVVAHVLASISVVNAGERSSKGRASLRLIWGGIGIALVILAIAALFDWLAQK